MTMPASLISRVRGDQMLVHLGRGQHDVDIVVQNSKPEMRAKPPGGGCSLQLAPLLQRRSSSRVKRSM